VIRPENGHLTWYIHRSSDNGEQVISWGLDTDGIYSTSSVDVDADGMTDPLVSRNENGQRYFYALKSSDGSAFFLPWGLANDEVKIGDFDGDGKTDFAAVREADGHLVWMINQSSGGERIAYWGLPGDK
jgi:hypothetical protein